MPEIWRRLRRLANQWHRRYRGHAGQKLFMPSLPIVCAAILGFTGVLYELVLAQTLSVLFGQSVVQYSVTIGLFLAGMGAGAHVSESWSEPRVRLWRVQMGLALLVPV